MPQRRVLLGKMIVKKISVIYGTKCSLPHAQEPTTGPYPQSSESSPHSAQNACSAQKTCVACCETCPQTQREEYHLKPVSKSNDKIGNYLYPVFNINHLVTADKQFHQFIIQKKANICSPWQHSKHSVVKIIHQHHDN